MKKEHETEAAEHAALNKASQEDAKAAAKAAKAKGHLKEARRLKESAKEKGKVAERQLSRFEMLDSLRRLIDRDELQPLSTDVLLAGKIGVTGLARLKGAVERMADLDRFTIMQSLMEERGGFKGNLKGTRKNNKIIKSKPNQPMMLS